MFNIKNIKIDYLNEPICIENKNPCFSWNFESTDYGFMQSAYEINVTNENGEMFWYSGKISDARSDNIIYSGLPLSSAEIYSVTVTAYDSSGNFASNTTHFETAPDLNKFTAKWITQKNLRNGWSPYLRTVFTASDKPQKARLYFCGLGYGEGYLNGKKVTDNLLDTPNTNFDKQISYSVYDVTNLINKGENALGALLGCGFYSQDRVWKNGTYSYGNMCLFCELHIWYKDGKKQTVVSDRNWKCDYSPIILNNVYGGETYDARLEQPNWCNANFDDSDWKSAEVISAPKGKLMHFNLPPIKRTRKITPVDVHLLHSDRINPGRSCDQTFIVDMGENFAGWVKINIPYSPAGAQYVLRFAERLKDGSLDYTTCGPFHTCLLQQDIYIARGDKNGETYEPRFIYHGFQYIEVTGINLMSATLPDNFIEGYAVNTDLKSAGSFECSFEMANKLQTLGLRTILSNYHSIPEDCPVREKCGWLGDAQLVSEVAINNFDMNACYRKYLEDIRTSKEIYGTWQMVSPGKRTCGNATALWGCAQVIIPYNLYLYYNDKTTLERYYPLMKEWIEHEKARSENLIIRGGLGDWCSPGGNGGPERMSVDFSSTAEFYRCCILTAKSAKILLKHDHEKELYALAEQIKSAINDEFLDRENLTYSTLGADCVAVNYGICPKELETSIIDDAVKILNERCGGQFHTGIYGNKFASIALCEKQKGDEMLKALFNPDTSSFAYMINMGAGSIWESFDDSKGRNEFFGGGGSLNHPMHFSFASYYYTHLLGISPDENNPGYKEFFIKPYPSELITYAKGERNTLYGNIRFSWETKDGKFRSKLTVPPNTAAKCSLPYYENGLCVADTNGKNIEVDFKISDNKVNFTLFSGEYEINC